MIYLPFILFEIISYSVPFNSIPNFNINEECNHLVEIYYSLTTITASKVFSKTSDKIEHFTSLK